jgi:hypothetical protein
MKDRTRRRRIKPNPKHLKSFVQSEFCRMFDYVYNYDSHQPTKQELETLHIMAEKVNQEAENKIGA